MACQRSALGYNQRHRFTALTTMQRMTIVSWISPFSLPGRWFKANLHTHTTQSDGEQSPQAALDWYRAHGYDLLALTDHWVLTEGRQVAPDYLLIAGTELNGPGYHMVALGLDRLPDRALEDDPQALALAVRQAGGMPIFAHPYWTGQTTGDLLAAPAVGAIEVYNAVCDVAYGLGYANAQWDEALVQGHRLTGLATDDVHWRYGAQGRGFCMIRAEALTKVAILEALEQGRFYASTGPRITDLRVVELEDGGRGLRVSCSPCQHITFYAKNAMGRRFWSPDERPIDGAVYPLKPDLIYLRVECHDGRGGIAWSNPVFIEDLLG
jgi:hypothetical protein